ncbi:MAG TPA: group I intron-associated PD-(D/E)XK endonuclease, partial [Solirubrobacterales bacterium]
LADIFGVYFPPTEAVYLVPLDAVAESEGRLRIEPTLNNQRLGIRYAKDFQIDRWTVESLSELITPATSRPSEATVA